MSTAACWQRVSLPTAKSERNDLFTYWSPWEWAAHNQSKAASPSLFTTATWSRFGGLAQIMKGAEPVWLQLPHPLHMMSKFFIPLSAQHLIKKAWLIYMEMFDLNYTPNRTKLGSSVNVKCCFPSLETSLSLAVALGARVQMMRKIMGFNVLMRHKTTHTHSLKDLGYWTLPILTL